MVGSSRSPSYGSKARDRSRPVAWKYTGKATPRPLRRRAAMVAPASAPKSESSAPAGSRAEDVGNAPRPPRFARRSAKRVPPIIDSAQETTASILPDRDRRSAARDATQDPPASEERIMAAAVPI